MNTGISSISTGVASPATKRSASPAQPGSTDTKTAATQPAMSNPVNSNSSVSASNNGKAEKLTPLQEAEQKPTLQEVIEISERLNKNIQKIQRDLNFSVDENLGEIVVKVIDRKTQEVIRQIPSEEMLNLSRNIDEVNSLLFDKIKA